MALQINEYIGEGNIQRVKEAKVPARLKQTIMKGAKKLKAITAKKAGKKTK